MVEGSSEHAHYYRRPRRLGEGVVVFEFLRLEHPLNPGFPSLLRFQWGSEGVGRESNCDALKSPFW